MKKLFFISTLLLCAIACIHFSCNRMKPLPEKEIAHTLLQQVDSFVALDDSLLAEAKSASPSEKRLQNLFLQTRLGYKKIEWATEYFTPVISRFVNGAPEEEVETMSRQVFQPEGLQVVEAYLFPQYDASKKNDLIYQLETMRKHSDKFKTYFANIGLFDWQIFDAAKLQVFRILTLGITGFDNPLTQKSMLESATSLQSVKQALSYYTDKEGDKNLMNELDAADQYLEKHTDFNSFDRATFITKFANPITTDITEMEQQLHIQFTTYNRLLKQNAKTLFDIDAFNVNAYTPDFNSFATLKKAALGQALFSDKILSGSNNRSCRSCHQPEKAFTDGLTTNTMIDSDKRLPRNTPTLINAALQPSQFDDIRSNTLEEQAQQVVQNKNEMHGSMKDAAVKLWQQEAYRKMFADAFPVKNRTNIDTLEIMNAIGAYIRSLVKLDSRFDDYMRGNATAMNANEIHGFNLFMGKGKCGTCHYMPLFNGTLPPRYMKMETEVIGVPQSKNSKEIDSDLGRYAIIPVESLKHSFKTVTVRNAARTAPYMHNGVFADLNEVMDFYNNGGGNGMGFKVENQTLPFDKLNLTNEEKNDIIAFIKCLDSKS